MTFEEWWEKQGYIGNGIVRFDSVELEALLKECIDNTRYSIAREVYREYIDAFDADEQPPDFIEWLSEKDK